MTISNTQVRADSTDAVHQCTVQGWSMVTTTEMHAHCHRQTSAPVTYLQVFIFLTPSVQARPHLIGLVCRHISMDGSFSRRRQGLVENGGNGDDAHVLGGLKGLEFLGFGSRPVASMPTRQNALLRTPLSHHYQTKEVLKARQRRRRRKERRRRGRRDSQAQGRTRLVVSA